LSQTTHTASNLCAGFYLVQVTDANGCQALDKGTITEPTVLSSTMESMPSECGSTTGSANVTVVGGTAPYQYLWGDSSNADSALTLVPGYHKVSITDTNGCTLLDSVDVGTTTATNDICVVTVTPKNQNLLVWRKPVTANVAGYNIYRNISGAYSRIGFHHYDSLSQFVDLTFGVDPSITSYRYKISVMDTCGAESELSDFHETIHLTANRGLKGEVNLIWDDYEGFPFSSYNILLDSTGFGNYFVLDNVPNTNFTYTHNNAPLDSAEYLIEVVMPSSCTSTRVNHNSTRSNSGRPSSLVNSGMDDLLLKKAKLFPNPVSKTLNIQFPGSEKWSYRVFDITGNLLEEMSGISTPNKTLNVGKWTPGIYLVQLMVGDQVVNHKVVKN